MDTAPEREEHEDMDTAPEREEHDDDRQMTGQGYHFLLCGESSCTSKALSSIRVGTWNCCKGHCMLSKRS